MARKTLGKQLRVQILTRDKYRCLMCGRTSGEVELEVDHIVPVTEGGTDEFDNLGTLCRDCNRGKSAYRFTDYRNMSVVPPELAVNFRFFHDERIGDYEQYHLYLYYKVGIHPGASDENLHHTWRIPGSAYDTSSNKVALEGRRRKEEEEKFLEKIRVRLIKEGKRLIINEEGVCEVGG